MPWQNSKEALEAMSKFLANHPNKKIYVVWDNAPSHKSKAIRKQLAKDGIMERVHLIAVPPYALDNNPIEHVWDTAKKTVANIQHETFEDTKNSVQRLRRLTPVQLLVLRHFVLGELYPVSST